ncbi:MAG: hypothetical protein HKL80_03050, partial [Acidimicrobiales bacterium]|nr:hypothetical protein [Acidimicrobiales bacterium]
DPETGQELPGWPQHTLPQNFIGSNTGVNFGDEPVIEPVAVGDLFHNGRLDVVVTSLSGNTYVFNAEGDLLPGWPQALNTNLPTLAIPRPDNPMTREPVMGSTSPPQLADLTGNGQLNIIQTGTDGYVHIWNPDGTSLPGWPVKVSLPSNWTVPNGYQLINDQRVLTPVAIAYFNGKNSPPDIVVKTQYSEVTGGGIQPLPKSISIAYDLSGNVLPGWPVVLTGIIEYYGSAQDAITEGISPPIATPGPNGLDQVIIDPLWTPPYLVNGNGTTAGNFGSLGAAASSLLAVQQNTSLAFTPSKLPPEVQIPFDSYGAVGDLNGSLTYSYAGIGTSTFAGALLANASGLGINDYISAFPIGSSSNAISGFPAPKQGIDFLAGPSIADVTGSSSPDLIDSGDSSALLAYLPNGQLAPGYPKYTGGWIIGAPSIGDLTSSGNVDIVATTRDGYLFAWSTPGKSSANNQWWHEFGNEWNTSSYGVDSRPPGVIQNASWQSGTSVVSFQAPGDNWYQGQVKSYNIIMEPFGPSENLPATSPAGTQQTITVPSGYDAVEIQAVDASGNLGTTATVLLGQVASNTVPPPPTTTSSTTAPTTPTSTSPSGPSTIANSLNANSGKSFLFDFVSAFTLLTLGVGLAFGLKKRSSSKK